MAVFKYYSCTSFQVLHTFANDFYILQRHSNKDINTVGNSNSLAILGNVAMQVKTDISQIRSELNRKTIKFNLQKGNSLVHWKEKMIFATGCDRMQELLQDPI